MMITPLAERIRPIKLEDYISQQHLVGKNGILTKHITSGIIPSIIFWGPPGTGKTTLSNLIANETKRPFYTLSAINSGVKDVRDVINKAKESGGLFTTKNPILFIDEIHRFSKSQQDSLLNAVEKGIVTLIGATTENPSFEVIPALLSRCQVYTLNSFSKDDLLFLIKRALKNDEILSKKEVELKEVDALIRVSGGDARKLLNILELVINSTKEPHIINNEIVLKEVQTNVARYDKTGDQHYDIISAFIKSIRGSDPNAASYWLARMIEGGEDVKFIARRLIISASEDIGLANPNALLLANATFEAVEKIGYPEARIILSQCTTYLATSPKSNTSYLAIKDAQRIVRETGDLSIPIHLRNAPTQLMKDLDYGKDYIYPYDYQNNFKQQDYMPKELKGKILFNPTEKNSKEKSLREYLKKIWNGIYDY